MKLLALLLTSILVYPAFSSAQTLLEANAKGHTYELIDSALAPGAHAEETPDQCTNHPQFGKHIREVWDETLKQWVFEFMVHAAIDNDRCENFDRQRVEIKTYEPSPDSLKGTPGETITYKWKFRLSPDFQPSPNFTHIHQIKCVGGDEGEPLFTLSPRYGKNGFNTLQLIYRADKTAPTSILQEVSLGSFLGTWVEATEVITVGAKGSYAIVIKKVSNGKTLLSYNTTDIKTFREGNSFIRPKWGIYRSLKNVSYLKDEAVRFNSFYIMEDPTTAYRK